MTGYNLNFWEEPDWSREGTLNPFFTLFAIAAVLTVLGLGWVNAGQRQLQKKVEALEMLSMENKALIKQAEEASSLKIQVAKWREAVDVYDELALKNYVWSSQLETIQSLVPDAIVIKNLYLYTTRAGDTMDSTNTYPLPAWTALLTLEGVATGPTPYQTINDFFDSLQGHEFLSRIMVANLASTAIAEGEDKRFKIDLSYTLR
ncbi:MAG: hypothetical protein RRC34_12650 [Lentisphaeria bacterium]|nr:hypothetical protein [Lentisphaeria bacterium]